MKQQHIPILLAAFSAILLSACASNTVYIPKGSARKRAVVVWNPIPVARDGTLVSIDGVTLDVTRQGRALLSPGAHNFQYKSRQQARTAASNAASARRISTSSDGLEDKVIPYTVNAGVHYTAERLVQLLEAKDAEAKRVAAESARKNRQGGSGSMPGVKLIRIKPGQSVRMGRGLIPISP